MHRYCVWAVLDHHRAMPRYREQQREKLYRRINTAYTPAVAVLVLGLGHMGSEIATRIHSLGFEVRGWRRTAHDRRGADGGGAPAPPEGVQCYAGRDALLSDAARGCNYVINALPLTDETKGVLNAALFDALEHGACVINVGRGAHAVQTDLLGALASGRLSRAYLDVFDEEPLEKDHPYWDHPQVTLTPHVAGELLPRSCAVSVARNIRAYSVQG
jgi:glyoxylate/hydroxypyruvate reductase A